MNYPIPSRLKNAHITPEIYEAWYAESIDRPDQFWGKQAKELLHWRREWETVQDSLFSKEEVHISWFEGGLLNVAENCIDRHLPLRGDQPAIIWEPDSPDDATRILTYSDLHREVCRTANMLLALGVSVGDRVTLYMPMVPEAAIAMLACARIGAVHSVVFGGFSAHSLAGRIKDSQSKLVITADEGVRGGKHIPLKKNVDEALKDAPVDKVLVLKRTGGEVSWTEGRDQWWHELAEYSDIAHHTESFDSEHPLFVLYTSGSTGQPKGLLHTSAGYLLYAAATFNYVFDYQPGEVYWCTADVGWITGHSYIVYGPLACGATTVMFEGIPTYPDASRFWQVVDKHNVSSFYTAPTAIRMLMREGDQHVTSTSRKSLRVLGSVGEPINPEAWIWYHDVVGNGECAVVDTWWQTETGGHLITPLAGATETKPGSATLPFFGVKPTIVDASNGAQLLGKAEGALCIADSWPGQARTIWNDHQRFIDTYFAPFPGMYFSGDAARRDEDGYYWIEGRMDDVINVSGHRIGTAEVEAAINEHAAVTESAVVGYPHDIKGQSIYAYVTTLPGTEIEGEAGDALRQEIKNTVRGVIGALAAPEKIHFTEHLPKTRSGKIMRRILRKIAADEIKSKEDFSKLGDISTLLNPEAVEELVKGKV